MRARVPPISASRRRSEQARAQAGAPHGGQDGRRDGNNGAGLSPAADLTQAGEAVRQMLHKLAAAAEAIVGPDHTGGADGGTLPFSLGGKQGSVVFGYTIRGLGDAVRAEPFGDIAPRPQRGARAAAAAAAHAAPAPAPASRTPIVDVFADASDIHVIAELPGVADSEVTCSLGAGVLLIETEGAHRYRKEIALPEQVAPDSLRRSCHNGILEVRLRRVAAP